MGLHRCCHSSHSTSMLYSIRCGAAAHHCICRTGAELSEDMSLRKCCYRAYSMKALPHLDGDESAQVLLQL
jgi:hypothetical protein